MMYRSDEQYENIACQICGKPQGLSASQCFAGYGLHNPLCRIYNHCRIDEKTHSQCEYVLSSIKNNTFLRACPGSGKTEVVGLKAAYEISKWVNAGSGIAVLTFTNNAADVIKERILQFTKADKIKYPHYVGTIDSWLHGYLANPFGHIITGYSGMDRDHSIKLIDETESGGWLYAFKCKTPYYYNKNIKDGTTSLVPMPLFANNITAIPASNTFDILPVSSQGYHHIINDDNYFRSKAFTEKRNNDRLYWLTLEYMRNGFMETKKAFWGSGFATYQDVEYICYELLHRNSDLLSRVSSRFPLIIVDECQDLSETQLMILKQLFVAGSTVHLVGDLNQAIYAFKKVDPQKVGQFAKDNGFLPMDMNRNFRSFQPIVDFCSKLVNTEENEIQGIPYNNTKPICVCFSYEQNSISDLVERFVVLLNNSKLKIEKSAILARSHSTICKLRPGESSKDLSIAERAVLASALWKTQRADSMNEALMCMGKVLASTIFNESNKGKRQYYCPQSISLSLRWRMFISLLLDACLLNECLVNLDTKQSIWFGEFSSLCQHIIEDNWTDYFGNISPINAFEIKTKIRDKSNPTNKLLDTTHKNSNETLRITTIHDVKGETIDAVLLVSSSRAGSGGKWTEWLDANSENEEYSRFAYVGSSRPKYLLAWAIPSPSTNDTKRLEDRGFTFIT